MENYIRNNILIDKDRNCFTFDLDLKNNLSYKMYDQQLKIIDENIIRDKDVLDYSIALDNDNIHIIYLLSSGNLHLRSYKDNIWKDFIIAKFNMKSNKYHQLELSFILGKFHIIYGYSNLINPNIYTIQHIIYKDNIEERHNVIEYISIDKIPYFSMDYDKSGTVHLLYNTTTDSKSYIYHCFYSPYRKSWSKNPKFLWEDIDTGFAYIFIDMRDSIHSLCLLHLNNKYVFSYKRMDTQGRNKFVWTNINLNNLYIPKVELFTLYEKDKSLYLDFIDNENIYTFKSQNYGNSWIKETQVKCSNFSRVNIIMNNSINTNLKINHFIIDLKDLDNNIVFKDLYPNIKKGYEETITQNNQLKQRDKGELEENPQDILVDNISDPEETDFTHIKVDKSIENIEFEINKLQHKIQEIQSKQSELLKLLEDRANQEGFYEKQILQVQEEIRMLKIPLMRKIFG